VLIVAFINLKHCALTFSLSEMVQSVCIFDTLEVCYMPSGESVVKSSVY